MMHHSMRACRLLAQRRAATTTTAYHNAGRAPAMSPPLGRAAVLFDDDNSLMSFYSTTASRNNNLAMLKELRSVSGAPMMECKKALEASSDDMDKAMDWLREHGAAKASSKLAGRETVEGLIGVAASEDHKSLAVVQVASETDFAGRSDTFVQLVQNVTASVLAQDGVTNTLLTTEQLHALSLSSSSDNASCVKDLLDNAIVAIRENLSVPWAAKYVATESSDTIWMPYVHNKVPGTETGTVVAAVLVGPAADATAAVDTETMQAVGKRLAMHVVAAKPQYLTHNDVPTEVLDKERAILQAQIELDDNKNKKPKPAEIVQKMIDGRVRKFYEQVCLTEQSHMVETGNPKVSQVLQEAGVQVHQFVHLAIDSAR